MKEKDALTNKEFCTAVLDELQCKLTNLAINANYKEMIGLWKAADIVESLIKAVQNGYEP